MSTKERTESVWVKVYIVSFFICGIALWYSLHPSKKIANNMDIELDKKVVDVLFSNGIEQADIIKQYIIEKTSKNASWNEFFKTVKVDRKESLNIFESSFRTLARSMKIGLSSTENDDGSVTYKFYLPNKTLSDITIVDSSRYKIKTKK
ncbi:MAG: hypothetical protein LBU55_04025 [Elusimicrobiota bacterium]|nr:hypothetical protein [Elusimicrobiota bacterium]